MIRLIATGILLIAAPLAGLLLTGADWTAYTEFPPRTQYIQHPGFSPILFALVITVEAVALIALLMPETWCPAAAAPKSSASNTQTETADNTGRFPWWGWLGLALIGFWWPAAWMRPDALGAIAQHTFIPLWLGFILTVDALVCLRKGHSMITRSFAGFALLFPVSAVGWWFFEYLNRFVQNWHYSGVDHYSGLHYALASTPAFATVLPAIFEASELIGSFDGIQRRYRTVCPLPAWSLRTQSIAVAAGVAGMLCISIVPALLFPLLWVAPLLVLLPLLHSGGERTPMSQAAEGDWRALIALALGTLLCGFFWELWNYYSMPKWHYAIPYLGRFRLFEMPIAGYWGYLPFGLECYCLYRLVKHAFPLRVFDRLAVGHGVMRNM